MMLWCDVVVFCRQPQIMMLRLCGITADVSQRPAADALRLVLSFNEIRSVPVVQFFGPNFAAWWAGVHVCEQLTQGCYAVCLSRGSNSRPSDRESRALTIEPPRHTLRLEEHLLEQMEINMRYAVLDN